MLLSIPEFAKEIPLGQKAKRGRKKLTKKALLLQPDDPIPEQFDENQEEDETFDEYNIEAETIDPEVPVLETQSDEIRAHIFQDEDQYPENLFVPSTPIDYEVEMARSFRRSLLEDLGQEHATYNSRSSKRPRLV